MLKQLLSTAVIALAAINAQALDLLPTFGNTGWSATYDSSTQTITYTGDWGGSGCWLGGVDYSDYSTVDFTIQPSSLALTLVVTYSSNGEDKTTADFAAGATELSLTLDASKKSTVYSVYLQCGTLTDTPTVTLISASVNAASSSDDTITVWTGETDLDNWNGQIDLPAAKLASAKLGSKLKLTYTLNDGADYGAFNIAWISGSWDWVYLSSMATVQGYDAENNCILVTASGETSIVLDANDVANFTNSGSNGAAIKGTGITVTKVELTDLASSVSTVIYDQNAPVEYYDLQGRKVANPTPGTIYVVRHNGKTTKTLFR